MPGEGTPRPWVSRGAEETGGWRNRKSSSGELKTVGGGSDEALKLWEIWPMALMVVLLPW